MDAPREGLAEAPLAGYTEGGQSLAQVEDEVPSSNVEAP
jgi:hypothetical protein